MKKLVRTHMCGELRREHAGQDVVLCGWVARRRDLGQIIFLDLRDRAGVVQLVFDPESADEDLMNRAKGLRNEFVIGVQGHLRERPEGTRNEAIPTGRVEVVVDHIRVLNEAAVPPFTLTADTEVSEDLRLRYRYLDLRRPALQRTLILRHETARVIRNHLSDAGFLEIETPTLTKSTPEGARDYIVPSRISPGRFYALPQSPQLFKQLLMIAGFDRYFQIVRCFRDEDLRSDRQPEFTQVDIEASFLDRDELFGILENLMAEVFEKIKGESLKTPFDRLDYQEAMDRYGSDKPERRFGLELNDLGPVFSTTDFRVFQAVQKNSGTIRGLCVPIGHYSRKQMDELVAFAQASGAEGLFWSRFDQGRWKGGAAKLLSEDEGAELVRTLRAKEGDVFLIVAGKLKTVRSALGALRLKLGRELDLIREDEEDLFWVVDFPLVEWSEEDLRYYAMHHPFTSPRPEDIPLMESDPAAIKADAYDLVWNGREIGGGSTRIHRPEVQSRMFKLLGIGEEEAREKFGFFLTALSYGTPPHGGIALGFDRIIMILAGTSNIREVIPFPKTARATCLMTGSPSPVTEDQLDDLGIRIKKLP